MSASALVGVDWGTSNFRAFLIDSEGRVLDRRSGPHGILTVSDGMFGQVLAARVGEWLSEGRVPILMSGMIGSRQGWVEAPYCKLPASLGDLAAALAEAPFEAADVRIVPGLELHDQGRRDVMRGEETQVFGLLARLGADGGRFLLPGTHSKWVTAEGGRITDFATYMTGEIFAAAREHTILGRLMQDGAPSGGGFLRGVTVGAEAGGPGALLNRLFGVRTAGLFGDIPPADLADYLSGILIGAEIADQRAQASGAVHIIASDDLGERYRSAGESLGVHAAIAGPDCIVDGHVAIARIAGLLPRP